MKGRKHFRRFKPLLFPRSLRYQLLARSLYVLAVLLLLIGGLQYVLMKNFVYQNKADSMRSQLASFSMELFDMRQDSGRPHRPFLLSPDVTLALIGPNGEITDLTDQFGTPAPILTQTDYARAKEGKLTQRHQDYRLATGRDGAEHIIVFRVEKRMGIASPLVQMSAETGPLKEVLVRQLLIFVGLSVTAMGGGLLLSLPVIRRTLTPLSRMVRTVQQIDAGNLSVRLPASQGQAEIDRLAASFNGMLTRLETSFHAEREAKEQMRRFIADASHELRTPLTSIHGFLEVLLRGAAENKDQLHSALTSMHGESVRMKKLVEDLLLLAKLDRAPQLQMVQSHLSEVLTEMVPHLRMLADSRKVRMDIAEQVVARFDTDKIKQVILNLFQNAVQHTDPTRGEITLKLQTAGNHAEITVQDNGIGIGEEHLPHLFERFYRSEASRTRASGGAGLGLAISRSIAQAHGGTITVSSRLGEGSLFLIRLPLAFSKP